jgi:biotin transport system substrate-specific component
MAQVRILLPWTPVPFTGQTFGVLLAAVLLGAGWSGVSLAIYVGLGVAGIPWFNGLTGGIQAIAGPTGGYLIGFILAATFLGYVTDKFAKTRNIFWLIGLMIFSDFVLLFGPGLIQLNLWMNLVKHDGISFSQLLGIGLVPFVVGDIIKIFAAAAMGWALAPKKSN